MIVNVCRKAVGNSTRKKRQLPAFRNPNVRFRAQTHQDLDTRKNVLIIESWHHSTLPKYCCAVLCK